MTLLNDMSSFKREFSQQSKSMKEAQNTSFSASDPNFFERAEVINANNGYLLILLRFMEQWGFASEYNQDGRCSNETYFFARLAVIRNMFTFIAPKMKKNKDLIPKIRKQILDYNLSVFNIFKSNDDAQMYRMQDAIELSMKIDDLFQDLLTFMEDIGMLTKAADDKFLAFGEYSD